MRRIAVSALAAVVLAGCNASTTGETREATPLEVSSGPATLTAEPGDKPEGRFYAVIGGETSNDNRAYELRFTPPALELLSDTGRVSSVSACRERVVVAAGQPEVGFSDHLQEVRGRTVVPLEGLGTQPGFTPELDDRCRVAYTWVDRESDSEEFELRVWEPGQPEATTLYRARPGDGPLVNPDWGPDGKIAVVRQAPVPPTNPTSGRPAGRPSAVVVVRPDGSSTEIAGTGNVVGLAWGRPWLAVMDESEGTVFVDAAGVRRSVLGGWYPLTWSPAGDRLLVHDAATRRTLGIVESADLGNVRTVGRTSGAVIDVDWLPA